MPIEAAKMLQTAIANRTNDFWRANKKARYLTRFQGIERKKATLKLTKYMPGSERPLFFFGNEHFQERHSHLAHLVYGIAEQRENRIVQAARNALRSAEEIQNPAKFKKMKRKEFSREQFDGKKKEPVIKPRPLELDARIEYRDGNNRVIASQEGREGKLEILTDKLRKIAHVAVEYFKKAKQRKAKP